MLPERVEVIAARAARETLPFDFDSSNACAGVTEFCIAQQRIRILTSLSGVPNELARRFHGSAATMLPAEEVYIVPYDTADTDCVVFSSQRMIFASRDETLHFAIRDLHTGVIFKASVGGFVDSGMSRREIEIDMLQCLAEIEILHTITARRPELQFVHAGAVERDGRAILILAGSGCGKTTLAVALGMQGFNLLSDDTNCIDLHEKLVHGYPRAPRIRAGSESLLRQLQPHGLSLPIVTTCAVRVSHVMFLNGFADHPRLQRIGADEAVWDFLDFLLNPAYQPVTIRLSQCRRREIPDEMLAAVSFINAVQCYRLCPGDLKPTARLIRETFGFT